MTIAGASVSIIGTIICSTGGGEEDSDDTKHGNESLGAIIATCGAIGGAIYMKSCRKVGPHLHPIHFSLIINIGMMITTFFICITALPEGLVFFSTDLSRGFFGFLNPKANPAAVLHSVFPDLGGNFGIMIALLYFENPILGVVPAERFRGEMQVGMTVSMVGYGNTGTPGVEVGSGSLGQGLSIANGMALENRLQIVIV